jgi:hypothetical protein
MRLQSLIGAGLGGRVRCDFAQRLHQIAGEQPVTKTFAKKPICDVPGNAGAFGKASGNRLRHKGPDPTANVRQTSALQFPVSLLDGVRIDLQLLGQFADGGQCVIRPKDPSGRTTLHFFDDLAEDRSGVIGIHGD